MEWLFSQRFNIHLKFYVYNKDIWKLQMNNNNNSKKNNKGFLLRPNFKKNLQQPFLGSKRILATKKLTEKKIHQTDFWITLLKRKEMKKKKKRSQSYQTFYFVDQTSSPFFAFKLGYFMTNAIFSYLTNTQA